MNITEPLRLAVGSHQPGSGMGCAMNVESWINGDTKITDLPACADLMLAHVVQRVNDTYCTHRDGDLLCAPCSIKVLELAARTRGTALDHLSDDERRRVWVRLALDEAESVASPDENPRVTECRRITALWLEGEADEHAVRAAAAASYAAARVAVARAAAAAYTASYASCAAARAAAAASYSAAYTAYTASYASYADAATCAAAAAYTAADGDTTAALARAHALIGRFEDLTGVRSTAVPSLDAARALMSATA